MQKQRACDPRAGTRAISCRLWNDTPQCVGRNIRVRQTPGRQLDGGEPEERSREASGSPERFALACHVVSILPRIDSGRTRVELRTWTTEPLSAVRDVQALTPSARGPVEAEPGRKIVITGGRRTGSRSRQRFMNSAGPRRLDRLSAGTIAGHIIECGRKCSGGNASRLARSPISRTWASHVEASPENLRRHQAMRHRRWVTPFVKSTPVRDG